MSKWLYILILGLVSCQGTPYVQGKRLYQQHCSSCHMDDGSGLSELIPDIRKSNITTKPDFICLLYTGKKDSIFSGQTFIVKEMPSFKHLSSTEINNIVNYINHGWFDDFKEKTILETQRDLTNCKDQ